MSDEKPKLGGVSDPGIFDELQSVLGSLFHPASGRGRDLEVDLKVTLPEAVHGATKAIEAPGETFCATCKGTGGAPDATFATCAVCRGRGSCGACRGRRGRWSPPCGACGGRGLHAYTHQVKVTVPPGVRPAQRLRLKGLGGPPRPHAPPKEGAAPEAGHLYVDLVVETPRGMAIEGDDLVVRVRLDPAAARRGGTLKVPWVEGVTHLLIPPGTAHGDRIVKPGWGLGPLGEPFARPPEDGAPYRSLAVGERGDLVVVALLSTFDSDSALDAELATPEPASGGPLVVGLAIVAVVLGALLSWR